MKRIGVMILSIILFATSVSAVTTLDISGVNITLLNQQPDPVAPGDTIEVRFSVERVIGPDPIENIEFQLVPEFPFSLVEGETGTRLINIIRPKAKDDQGVILFYKLKVSPEAQEGTEDLVLEYGKPGLRTRIDNFKIRIRSQDAVITVSQVTTIPDPVLPGKPVDAIFTVTNHADSVLKNVRLKLELGGSDFSPYKTSNERSLKILSPGQVSDIVFPLIADGEAKSKVHTIPLLLEYEDETGETFGRNATVGLIVNEKPTYVASIEETTAVEKGSTGTIILSLSNVGTGDLKFVILQLLDGERYEVLSAPQVYIGNIEPDDFETADFKIYIDRKADRSVPLLLRLTYRDNFNEEYEDDITLHLKLYSSGDVAKFQLKEIPSKVGGLIAFLILVLVMVFMLFMILDWSQNKLPRYKKMLWFILILTGIGAVLYYYMVRRKER